MELTKLTIKAIGDHLTQKKFSAKELTQEYLKEIEQRDGEIGAYLFVNKEGALQAAEEVDRSIAAGEDLKPLTGVPLAIKDNILIKDLPATAASHILEHYTASYDAGVITKLKEQKAVFLGKANLDEFAMGASTENSGLGRTRHPHDPERVPGGSSGGSAAAVGAKLAAGALGSDTGGSIRQPAAFSGVVGLKPTYGAVSRSGLIAMSSSLDQIGPLTATVEDAAILFHAIAGADPLDATADRKYVPNEEELLRPQRDRITSLTVGIPEEYFIDGLSPEVASAVQETIEMLKKAGISFKKVSLPHTKYALSCYYIIQPAEVSSNMARFDGIRYARDPRLDASLNLSEIYLKQRGANFGPEVKRRIILGTFVLSSGYYDAYYGKAQQVRALITQDFEKVFEEVDVLLTPVTPTTAFKFGEKTDDPLAMYLEDIFTVPVNLAGLPAVSIPVRGREGKLPIGFQIIGKHFREADILGLGQMYESL